MIDYNIIDEDLKYMLKPSRYEHILRVVEKAVELGDIYRANIDKCKLAALLHDCAKGNEKHYKEKYSDIYNRLIEKKQYKEFSNPFLQHCLLGRIVAREKYEVEDEDILNAILYHTTGRVNMTIYEKIIYLADKTEDGRDYPEVDDIRKASIIDLNSAIIISINNNIKYLIDRNQEISVNSILLRNQLIGGISEGKIRFNS